LKNQNKQSEIELKVLNTIQEKSNQTQRSIAEGVGVSLGKTNYLIKSLIDKGLLKINNFKRADNKLSYLYILTPEGIEARRRLTISFLQRKSEEYEELKKEIERMDQNND